MATNKVVSITKAGEEAQKAPWSGSLDDAELGRPGSLLLAALVRCAGERGQQLNDMARELGVTYGYINQLRNGIRKVDQVSDDFALACAAYLGVPRMTVLMMAGRITPQDLFESREMMSSEVTRAMNFICDDPTWGHLVTPELRATSLESQFLLVRLYEKGTGKKLMDEALDPSELAKEIERLRALQAARQQQRESMSAPDA